MNGPVIFVLNLVATWYMVGLIWMVQVVHYNLFDRVGGDQFAGYEADHTRLITPIVAVPMLVEITTACLLLVVAPAFFPRWAAWAGVAMVIAIWLSTAFLQVPCHNRLASGFDEPTYRTLLATNWLRTMLWTARGAMLGYFAATGLR